MFSKLGLEGCLVEEFDYLKVVGLFTENLLEQHEDGRTGVERRFDDLIIASEGMVALDCTITPRMWSLWCVRYGRRRRWKRAVGCTGDAGFLSLVCLSLEFQL
jgi:hypothetical protein